MPSTKSKTRNYTLKQLRTNVKALEEQGLIKVKGKTYKKLWIAYTQYLTKKHIKDNRTCKIQNKEKGLPLNPECQAFVYGRINIFHERIIDDVMNAVDALRRWQFSNKYRLNESDHDTIDYAILAVLDNL